MLILKNDSLQEYEEDLSVLDGKIVFNQEAKLEINPKAKYIVPGFIDQHIHGANGCDVMDNSIEAIIEIAKGITEEGTTSFFPTTMTYDLGILKEVLLKIKQAKSENNYANIIGVHLEGPFISEEYIGAQNPIYATTPSVEILKMIDPEKIVKLITYAPEEDENFEFTKYLKEQNIIASVGHSGATCHCVEEAIKNGLTNFTHFHNASSGHHHRAPGVVSAGLGSDSSIKLELIVDGIHVHPDAINTTYKVKGSDELLLITDAMRAKNMPDGTYDLGGQNVNKKGNEARLDSGVLAGSVLKMNNAVQNFISFTNCSPEEAFRMASKNVALHHGLATKGFIKNGYDGDIVTLDEEFNVLQTFIAGKEVYNSEK